MGYEALGEVEVVSLGGVNKATGRKNPTEIEGYLLSVEQRPNKFNPGKPQNFYIFQTKDGEKGVYGKAGIDKVLKGARLGAMTKLVATGEVLDTGKGNPMKVFKGFQDKTNTVDVASIATSSTGGAGEGADGGGDEWGGSEDAELFSEGDAVSLDEVVARPAFTSAPSAPSASKVAAALSNQDRIKALMSRSKNTAAR